MGSTGIEVERPWQAICTKVSSHAIFTWSIEHVPTSECGRQKVLLSASALHTLRFLPSMPDAFFASNKNRKRKRSSARDAGPSTSKKVARGAKGKPQNIKAVAKKRSVADEELSEDTQDDDEREGIDELDLRAPDVDPDAYESGEEDEDDGEFKAESDGEEEQDEEDSSSKKRKKATGKVCN